MSGGFSQKNGAKAESSSLPFQPSNNCTNNAGQSCFPSQSQAPSSSFCSPSAKFVFQLQKLVCLKTASTQQGTGRSDVILPQELQMQLVWVKSPECVWIPCPGGWKSAQGHRGSLRLAMEPAGDGKTLLCLGDLGEVKPSPTETAPCGNGFI